MTEQHQITPPRELFKQWEDNILNDQDNVGHVLDCAWKDGYRAGADAELKACCEHLRNDQWGFIIRSDLTRQHRAVALKLARRPKLENNG